MSSGFEGVGEVRARVRVRDVGVYCCWLHVLLPRSCWHFTLNGDVVRPFAKIRRYIGKPEPWIPSKKAAPAAAMNQTAGPESSNFQEPQSVFVGLFAEDFRTTGVRKVDWWIENFIIRRRNHHRIRKMDRIQSRRQSDDDDEYHPRASTRRQWRRIWREDDTVESLSSRPDIPSITVHGRRRGHPVG